MKRVRTDLLSEFQAIGGLPCLDFVNTVDWRASAAPVELLVDGRAAAQWSALVLGVDIEVIDDAAVRDLRTLREAVFRLITWAGGADDLRALNDALAVGGPRSQLAVLGDRLTWAGDRLDPGHAVIGRAVARSAADLLVDTERMDRVKACDGDGCGWLFLDTSRAGTRRWCSMQTCGNRYKARRHYRQTARS